MEDMMKVLHINAYIQRGMGEVTLDGKTVICVALDKTCAFEGEGDGKQELTDEQINNLFLQTFGLSR